MGRLGLDSFIVDLQGWRSCRRGRFAALVLLSTKSFEEIDQS